MYVFLLIVDDEVPDCNNPNFKRCVKYRGNFGSLAAMSRVANDLRNYLKQNVLWSLFDEKLTGKNEQIIADAFLIVTRVLFEDA